MSTNMSKHSELKRSFQKSLGVMLPVLIVVLLAGTIVLGHDYLYANRYTTQPNISADNRWGGHLINIDIIEIDTYEGHQGSQGTFRDCEPPAEGELQLFECKYNDRLGRYVSRIDATPASFGYTKIQGRIYIKNSYWTRSNKIPVNLIEYRYGEDQTITATIDGYTPGSFLGPRSGTSADFKIDVPVYSPNGKFFINDGTRSAELIYQ